MTRETYKIRKYLTYMFSISCDWFPSVGEKNTELFIGKSLSKCIVVSNKNLSMNVVSLDQRT